MTHCPSCGRYTGPSVVCPHCGAGIAGRTSIRALKIAALSLSIGGLALLWWLATRTAVPLVEIGQLDALMNLAYVRVEGQVTRPPTYDPGSEYLSFWVADQTGELHVAVYQDTSRALAAARNLPGVGDFASVAGSVRVREDYVSLTLQAAEQLQLRRAAARPRRIGDITRKDALQRVEVSGQIRAITEPYPGLTLLRLQDGSGEIDLAIPESIDLLGNGPPPVAAGDSCQVEASVSLYRDAPQLSLTQGTDLQVLEQPFGTVPRLTLDQIDAARIGQWAQIEGEIVSLTPFSAGKKYRLNDARGEITLVLWQRLCEALDGLDGLAPGARVVATGRIDLFRGEIEIVPELPMDIRILGPAPPALPTVTPEPDGPMPGTIAALRAAPLGQTETVRGAVVDATSLAQGFKFVLDDASAQIDLVTWLDIYDRIAGREGLRPGALVQVTGTLQRFDDQLQLVPSAAEDVIVLRAGDRRAPHREIGSLSDADLEEWIALSGQIEQLERFSDGLRLQVSDGGDTLSVVLWDEILARLPKSAGIPEAGGGLQAQGKLQTFRKTLELVPVLPYDVQFSPPAATPTLSPSPSPRVMPTPSPSSLPTSTPAPVAPTPVPLAAVDETWLGRRVTLSGVIQTPGSFSAGFRFTLSDGTGQLTMLLWHEVYDGCPQAALLNTGASVRVAGEITQFEGELQIEPSAGHDVVVTAPGGPVPAPQPIGTLADMVGGRATIAGQVQTAGRTSSGLIVTLTDDSGQVAVFIWDNVLARIAENELLSVPGTRVQVLGSVQTYQGNLELVPALPYDVTVLP